MKYHELQVKSNKNPTRVGRGISAGKGKTAGRGTKGQNSRSGSSKKPGFEGGQNPLSQKLPKLPGFKSHRKKIVVVYTGQLDSIKSSVVDNRTLTEAGIINSPHIKVKLILNGELKNKYVVKLQSSSSSAKSMVEKAGGSFESIPQLKREKKVKKSD